LSSLNVDSEVNESAAEEVMTAVRATIATYPFLFHHPQQQVRILTGIEEGTYSWIATNYLSENFDVCSSINLYIIINMLVNVIFARHVSIQYVRKHHAIIIKKRRHQHSLVSDIMYRLTHEVSKY